MGRHASQSRQGAQKPRWLRLLSCIGVVIGVTSLLLGCTSPPPSTPTGVPIPEHYTLGNPNARVVIEEWTDLQ